MIIVYLGPWGQADTDRAVVSKGRLKPRPCAGSKCSKSSLGSDIEPVEMAALFPNYVEQATPVP